jgi:predicted  nucleic acid-binding Zn-ribbon protein
VTVPDPLVLEELQKAQAEISRLRDQISGLQEENTNQANIISQQNEEISDKIKMRTIPPKTERLASM